jgi:diguanylate cyclase (GGDEF)-like protein/PAS domain S-box-containing protein
MHSAIICVDDDWIMLKNLGAQLKRSFGKEYEILLAGSGEEAISLCADLKLKNKEIALFISDQRMPGMRGDDLLIHLHSLEPDALKIMLTGEADAESVGKVVNQAALYRYICKPWDTTDLKLTVTEALRRFKQEKKLVEQNSLLKSANAHLESSLSLLSATLEATADGILVLDNDGRVINFNQKLAKLWDLDVLELVDGRDTVLKLLARRLVGLDASRLKTLLTQVNSENQDCLTLKNGKILEYFLQPYLFSAQRLGVVLSFRDVTQAQQTAAIMQHRALHDALTNLPNRVLFNQKFSACLQNAAKSLKPVAVMFLDVDHFKAVNDTLGHAVGDLLLQHVVQRLQSGLRGDDVLARWGGDEFVLLLSKLRSVDDIGDIARRLIEALQPAFNLQGYALQITASIGIAVYPNDGQDSQTLLNQADEALYQAKKSGRNTYQFYSSKASLIL